MTPRRKTSKKLSAASSSEKRLESVVFYLDESIYSRVLCEALESAGITVRRPGRDIEFGTRDEVWLATAGNQGWIVLMRDQRVRYRALEIQSLRDAKVGAFVLTAGQATAQAATLVLLGKLPMILNIARSERKPFLYTLGMIGALSRVKIR
jgi:hypothetical protein